MKKDPRIQTRPGWTIRYKSVNKAKKKSTDALKRYPGGESLYNIDA